MTIYKTIRNAIAAALIAIPLTLGGCATFNVTKNEITSNIANSAQRYNVATMLYSGKCDSIEDELGVNEDTMRECGSSVRDGDTELETKVIATTESGNLSQPVTTYVMVGARIYSGEDVVESYFFADSGEGGLGTEAEGFADGKVNKVCTVNVCHISPNDNGTYSQDTADSIAHCLHEEAANPKEGLSMRVKDCLAPARADFLVSNPGSHLDNKI